MTKVCNHPIESVVVDVTGGIHFSEGAVCDNMQEHLICKLCGEEVEKDLTDRRRVRLSNRTAFIEFSETETGIAQARAYRVAHAEYKGCVIRHGFQLLPDEVPLRTEMKL